MPSLCRNALFASSCIGALYAGDYLPDDLFEERASERREALRRTWTELQFGLARALDARCDVNAPQPLERLLRADPCDEGAAQGLMKMLSRRGRRTEALRVFQHVTHALRAELDVEPSADTVGLHRHIESGYAVTAVRIPAVSFRCTYPFPVVHELFGREAELSVLSEELVSTHATPSARFRRRWYGSTNSSLRRDAVLISGLSYPSLVRVRALLEHGRLDGLDTDDVVGPAAQVHRAHIA
jgi:hypothetical protein